VYTFLRSDGDEALAIAVNLSDSAQDATIEFSDDRFEKSKPENVYGKAVAVKASHTLSFAIGSNGVQVWRLK
jgi:hypothetical protein